MQIISKKLNFNNKFSSIIKSNFKDYIFFDIETTGFSPKNSSLYMIGLLYFTSEKEVVLKQIFLEGLSEEKSALEEFISTLKNFKYVISFNGDNFDFPFIKACLDNYAIDISILDEIKSIDLYKIARKFKILLGNDKLNQTSLEKVFSLSREDKYNGGQLINIYKDYISGSCKDEKALYLLLLHNECDILGLVSLSLLLDLEKFLSSDFNFSSSDNNNSLIVLSFKSAFFFDYKLSANLDEFNIEIYDNVLNLSCPIFISKLKYFFENYKDYFYLPAENICIHKDIADFVDKSAKIKAKKENVFLEKEGKFLLYFGKSKLKQFRKDYKAKENYILLDEIDFENMSKDILLGIRDKYKF